MSAPNNTLEEHTSTSVTQFQATDHQSDSTKTITVINVKDVTLNVSLLFVNNETTSNPGVKIDQPVNTENENWHM